MHDAMVTGRMSSAKKQAGARVLDALGLTASQAINQFYDYLIREHKMPCEDANTQSVSTEELKQALEFVQTMSRKNQFTHMTDDEIKQHKLAAKGFDAS